jgi:hypothetical protein
VLPETAVMSKHERKEPSVPTILPNRRRATAKPVKQKQTVASLLFNAFMICSALALTFVVLVTEERAAFGPQKDAAATMEQSADSLTPH